ncbi:MAG: glutamyl-tRNA reductase [Chloroflexi bacterium]|nr:glutamyl-tRNA reductase [Chloroflexota bacterium]
MPLEYLVVGLNHRTAPLEVRERLSLTKADLPEALHAMERFGVPGVILSTCNRSEFYVLEPFDSTGSPAPKGTGEARVKEFLVEHFNVSLPEIEGYLYAHSGRQCIIHLFRVASGLDSMILGEEQIIGQVREAYDAGLKTGTIPGPLSKLFQQALSAGRKVRRKTGISHNALSVSRACVELAKETLGNLGQLTAMVVGSGDAGGLAAEVLNLSGIKDIVITNRTHQRAVELAKDLAGRAIPFHEMPTAIRDADIVIGCTGSPGYVVEASMVREAMACRAERPLFLIDIAVPRDIDPAAGLINNVVLRDVDDLESISTSSHQDKEREAQAAEELVAEEADHFVAWQQSQHAQTIITALRNQAERIRAEELNKTVRKLSGKLGPQELASLEAMTRAIVKKLLHGPTIYMKEQSDSDIDALARDMFRLTDVDDQESSDPRL